MTRRNFLAVSVLAPVACPQSMSGDGRNIKAGSLIPKEGYVDQPYIVITNDGNWLCVLTTGSGVEGQPGQHVVSTISNDKGKTWTPLIDIEPVNGPEASWVMPLRVASGRVYVFYTYNKDNLREVAGTNSPSQARRVDTLGYYAYKYSDDSGRTWSKDRYYIPMRLMRSTARISTLGRFYSFGESESRSSTMDGSISASRR